MKKYAVIFLAIAVMLSAYSCSETDSGSNPVIPQGTPAVTVTATATPVMTPTVTVTPAVYAEIYGSVYKQIDGQVTYNPHQGAEVRLWQGSAAVDTCVTDSLGEFIFTDVLPGTYDIVAVIHEVLLGTFCKLNNGPWDTLPNDHTFNSGWYVYTTKTAVTVAAGDSFSVDFRFVGY